MVHRVSVADLLKLQNFHYFGLKWKSDSIAALGYSQKGGHCQVNEDKQIGLTTKDQKALVCRPPDSQSDMLTLKVAIIGAPNAGKSTLANKLIGWKFAPVSQKVHTTRHKSIGVFTEDNKQLIFVDTPGIVVPEKLKRHNLEMSLLADPHLSLYNADLIVVVVDISHIWHRTKLEPEILKMLSLHQNKQSLLVLNKVDMLKDRKELLNITRTLTEGFVGGEKNSNTIKSKNKTDLDSLFKAMKREKTLPKIKEYENEILKKLGSNDGHDDDDEYVNQERNGDPIIQQIQTNDNNTSINVCHSSQILSDSEDKNISSDHDVIGETIGQAMDDIHHNLRNLKIWNLYYKNLRQIGRKLIDKHGWPHFSRVFMLSALQGDGIFELRNYLLSQTHPSHWQFNSAVVTNQNPIELAKLCVWEKLLDHLPDDVPYKIKVKLSLWEVTEDDLLRASFDLICYRKQHVNCILGRNGETIQQIASEAKQELMNAFRREMSLQLVVRGSSLGVRHPRKAK